MVRHKLTDEQWDLIADLFAEPKATGRPPVDRRRVFDGILWSLRTGSPWRDLPDEFGAWQTVWRLFDQWNADGLLDTMLARLRNDRDIDAELWCIDGTSVRAHKCAVCGEKKATPENRRTMRSVARVAV